MTPKPRASGFPASVVTQLSSDWFIHIDDNGHNYIGIFSSDACVPCGVLGIRVQNKITKRKSQSLLAMDCVLNGYFARTAVDCRSTT